MKIRSLSLISAALLALVVGAPSFADDGQRLVRSVSSAPGSDPVDPEPEGEHAFIKLMNFHVPSQNAAGELVPVEYYNIDDVLVKTEEKAKPLVNVYVYGPVIGFDNPEASGFAGHGRRDAFGAISLDDGETWKVTNLSNSADESSFIVSTPLPDPGLPEGGAEPIVDAATPIVDSASYEENGVGRLAANGSEAPADAIVDVRDAYTKVVLAQGTADGSGNWEIEVDGLAGPPCLIQAGVGDVWGPTFEPEGVPADCTSSTLITDYPGDVPNVFHAVAGNKVLVAWHSKYCSTGSPNYALSEESADIQADFLGIDNAEDLYMVDMFGVGGSQSSTNYNELDAEPVGEVPYSCLWSARGILREDPEELGTTEVVWLQAERLTSGGRDVNRVETACVAGAGCAITWQEDPEGVRPGSGEGPGTGWSGATTASTTDIWYSFISWEDFDLIVDVEDPTANDIKPLGDNVVIGRPSIGINMAVPVRLTNNDRCITPPDATVDPDDPYALNYCADANAGAYGIINQCVGTIDIPLGPQGNLQPICVVDSNDDGSMNAGDMPNLANTAASRPRLNMQPRDSDGDGIVDDAWVVVVSEEDKGLGRFGFETDQVWALDDLDDTGTACDPGDGNLLNCQKADVGKNVFWASFNLGSPATSEGVTDDYSLVNNVLVQGAQLNQPEVNWRTGVYYPPMDTADMWNFANGEDLNYLIFNTEIARRTSMMSQSLAKAVNSDGHLIAMPLWKQGIVNQGGPADISTRRIVVPVTTDPADTDGDGVLDVDDNCVNTPNPGQEDFDLDGVGDVCDNCINAPNGPDILDLGGNSQLDTNGDGYGNMCDADLDQSGFVDFNDLTLFSGVFFTADPDADMNGDGFVEFNDLTLFSGAFFQPPGPSCVDLPGGCTGTGTGPVFFDETIANPYDASNIVCAFYDGKGNEVPGVKYFTDGSNPYYPNGLCMAQPINLSARTPFECEASGTASDGLCPGVSDMTCVDDASFGLLCSSVNDPENSSLYDKALSWYECPGWNGVNVSNDTPTIPGTCGTEPDSALIGSNMDDVSWYNPLEVSKAHRGFLDGNHVFMIYAWSPNYKLNTVGRDRYELYTRRSFDGGITWTTTPDSFLATDGVTYSGVGNVTCETMRDGATSLDDSHVCTEYEAGDPEQSRNVSQLKSMANTILDPRYTPTIASMPTAGELDWGLFEPIYPTDIRDPSRNFVVFEDGDNTTVAVGEAEPLNLAYGRAEMFGDNFTVWAETDTVSADVERCYPNDAHGDPDVDWAVGTGFCNEFDTLEGFQDALSEEASITSSAYGDFLYSVWGQFNVDLENDKEFIDGDSMFRRVWYLDNYISPDNSWTLPGQ